MKAIFGICAVILVGAGLYFWKANQGPVVFGEFIGAPKVEVLDVINQPTQYMDKTVAMEGTITKQCMTMGCYFFFVDSGKEIRVELAEIAMNAPKGKNGTKAKVEGRVVPYDKAYQFSASAVEFE